VSVLKSLKSIEHLQKTVVDKIHMKLRSKVCYQLFVKLMTELSNLLTKFKINNINICIPSLQIKYIYPSKNILLL